MSRGNIFFSIKPWKLNDHLGLYLELNTNFVLFVQSHQTSACHPTKVRSAPLRLLSCFFLKLKFVIHLKSTPCPLCFFFKFYVSIHVYFFPETVFHHSFLQIFLEYLQTHTLFLAPPGHCEEIL